MLTNGQRCVVVDPGDARVVEQALSSASLVLDAILLTHHHADHTGGVAQLRDATGCRVFGPQRETMPEPLHRLSGGDAVEALGLSFSVIDVPGHTAGHIAYFCADASACEDARPILFCGDTLFSGGCGRLFEGSPAQMLASLDSLAQLPGESRVCCTHEYTLSNLRFAKAVDPDNQDLHEYDARCQSLRAHQLSTLPSSLQQELLINPFLRSRHPALVRAAHTINPDAHTDVDVFTTLREWKNNFK